MNSGSKIVTSLCAAVLTLTPTTEAWAVVSAAQAAKILAVVNQVNDKVTAVKKEVDGLNDLTQDSNTYLERIVELNTAHGAGLDLINKTLQENQKLLQGTLKATTEGAAAGQATAALVGDAYASRTGHSVADIANAVSGCGRGQAARLGGNAAVMPNADGTSTSAAAAIAQELAHAVGERQPLNSPDYARALFGVPDAMKTGAQFSAGAAFTEADLKKVKELSWLTAPKPAAGGPVEMAYDGVYYGLPRQVMAHWYAGLMPLSKGYDGTADLPARYPAEALPVVWEDDQARVPAHGLLRAEALSPWYDASPVDPSLSYSGWLLSLDQAGLLREVARLLVINNRVAYENLVYSRFDALMAAEDVMRQ